MATLRKFLHETLKVHLEGALHALEDMNDAHGKKFIYRTHDHFSWRRILTLDMLGQKTLQTGHKSLIETKTSFLF